MCCVCLCACARVCVCACVRNNCSVIHTERHGALIPLALSSVSKVFCFSLSYSSCFCSSSNFLALELLELTLELTSEYALVAAERAEACEQTDLTSSSSALAPVCGRRM